MPEKIETPTPVEASKPQEPPKPPVEVESPKVNPAAVKQSAEPATETKEEKPKLPFPKRVWHRDGLHSSRIVSSQAEMNSFGHDWTDEVPTPKKPEPLDSGEIHAKRIFPAGGWTPEGSIHAKSVVPKN